MRLAISVIGWDPDDDERSLAVLSAAGAEGLEAVPTRLWGSWAGVTNGAVDDWRQALDAHGLECPALQSLFYGIEGVSLTGSGAERAGAAEQLRRVARLGGRLGARVAVLGSPANRRRGELNQSEATRRARKTLLDAADAFAEEGVTLGVEPNPTEYGCDFLTTYSEVREFVSAVGHPAIAPHLDTGALRVNREEPELDDPMPAHVHLSTPHLKRFDGEPRRWHADLLDRLRGCGYRGWISIEQRPDGDRLEAAESAVHVGRQLLESASE